MSGDEAADADDMGGCPLERPHLAGIAGFDHRSGALPAGSPDCYLPTGVHTPVARRLHVIHLALNRLPPSRCAEIIASVTAGKALPKEISDQISDRADGVPLFIEELTKAVLESGAVT